MFNWLWEQLQALLQWLWDLPRMLAEGILGVLTDLVPDSVLADISGIKPYIEIANQFVPLVETFGLMAIFFTAEIAFIGVRTVFRIIRG